MAVIYHAIFGVLAIGLLLISWRSLCNPRSHGFFRLFVFEACLFLLWRNLPVWFDDRYAWHQLISWGLLFPALYLLIHSLYLLRREGGDSVERQGQEANFAFENTSVLVENGLYRWMRHPMYAALLLFTWGVFFKQPDILGLAAALLASVAMWACARVEERENIAAFGQVYRAYMQRTARFIPFVW